MHHLEEPQRRNQTKTIGQAIIMEKHREDRFVTEVGAINDVLPS